jgi:predicted nucleic acid-binding protein
MSVLVDTPIWSYSLRRIRPTSPFVDALADLINSNQALLIGPIRQEILSGINNSSQFTRLRDELRFFPDLRISERHWERAAECRNLCRSRGIQGSATDFVICAAAEIEGLPIFTTDRDFELFAGHLPIKLFQS